MKFFILVSSLFVGSLSLACPNFSGKYVDINDSTDSFTWNQIGCESLNVTFTTVDSNGQTVTHNINIVIDGKLHKIETENPYYDSYIAQHFSDNDMIMVETDILKTPNANYTPVDNITYKYSLDSQGNLIATGGYFDTNNSLTESTTIYKKVQ